MGFSRGFPRGRTIWIADAHRGAGKRFVVHADELLTSFVELVSAIRVGNFFFSLLGMSPCSRIKLCNRSTAHCRLRSARVTINAHSRSHPCELARQPYRIRYSLRQGLQRAGVLCKGEDVCLELRELSAAKLTIS